MGCGGRQTVWLWRRSMLGTLKDSDVSIQACKRKLMTYPWPYQRLCLALADLCTILRLRQ